MNCIKCFGNDELCYNCSILQELNGFNNMLVDDIVSVGIMYCHYYELVGYQFININKKYITYEIEQLLIQYTEEGIDISCENPFYELFSNYDDEITDKRSDADKYEKCKYRLYSNDC